MTHTYQPPRPLCRQCRVQPARRVGRTVAGYSRWGPLCAPCSRHQYSRTRTAAKADSCSSCGFVASHPIQLDVVEGSTLCANCHRLHTLERLQRRTVLDITIDSDVPLSEL